MADPDRDLLFALMALRSNLITSDELLAAVGEIVPEETRSLGDYLIGRGVLRGEEVAAIERELADRPGANGSGGPDARTRDWSRAPGAGSRRGPRDPAGPVRDQARAAPGRRLTTRSRPGPRRPRS